MSLPPHWRAVLDADLSRLPTGRNGSLRDCRKTISVRDLVWITSLRRQTVASWLWRNGVHSLGRHTITGLAEYPTAQLLAALRGSRGQGNHTRGDVRQEAIAKRHVRAAR